MTARTAEPAAARGPVKLSCQHVWKVYGPRPNYYFDSDGYQINPGDLARRMRAEKHIPAAVDVSFDVHVGEIFVIMGLSGSGKSTIVGACRDWWNRRRGKSSSTAKTC